MKSNFEKRNFNSDIIQLDVAKHLDKLATLPASIEVVSNTFCETNGASFYYTLRMEGFEKSVKLRLSDHVNGEGYGIHVHQLDISVNAGLVVDDITLNEVLYAFGLVTRSLEVVEWEDAIIEVMAKDLRPAQDVVSQRVTKNGNTLCSIKIKRPLKSQIIYKNV